MWREPAVDHDKPIPKAAYEPKKERKQPYRPRPPSPWIAFLQALKVGDSFVSEWAKLATIDKYAKQVGIETYRQTDHAAKPADFMTTPVRVWRIK